MRAYVYPFRLDEQRGEIFFVFQHFPEVISALPRQDVAKITHDEIQRYADDAVLTALQTRIATRGEIPSAQNSMHVRADGFVMLTVPQAMKLELFSLYKEHSRTVSEFACLLHIDETAARRLLDLTHNSRPSQIEAAIAAFGRTLVHMWDVDNQPALRTRFASSRAHQVG